MGDTASHFVWDMVGFWLLFFYTDVYGISAAAVGTIMLVARFWDMAIDLVIGVNQMEIGYSLSCKYFFS